MVERGDTLRVLARPDESVDVVHQRRRAGPELVPDDEAKIERRSRIVVGWKAGAGMARDECLDDIDEAQNLLPT